MTTPHGVARDQGATLLGAPHREPPRQASQASPHQSQGGARKLLLRAHQSGGAEVATSGCVGPARGCGQDLLDGGGSPRSPSAWATKTLVVELARDPSRSETFGAQVEHPGQDALLGLVLDERRAVAGDGADGLRVGARAVAEGDSTGANAPFSRNLK